MVQTHPQKIIETEQGNIVMESPDVLRSSALVNSIYSYILTDEDLDVLNEMTDTRERDRFIRKKSLKRGMTMYQLTALSYVVSAPFHLNDYAKEPILDIESFLKFADMELIAKMAGVMKSLGQIDPLSL